MMYKNLASICIFVYDRHDHLERVMENLKLNTEYNESEIYIFSDGAGSESKTQEVNQVRNYLYSLNSDKKINIIERDSNFGLEKSITNGVSYVLTIHETVIVLEDDILVGKNFLKYMNEALTFYKNNERVMHISGYIDPCRMPELDNETFFISTTSCWGWATWRNSWNLYQSDPQVLYDGIVDSGRLSEFDMYGTDVFKSQLLDNIYGVKSTWAIKWMASVFLKEGLCLHPKLSLTKNIGFGEGATNTTKMTSKYIEQKLFNDKVLVDKIPLILNAQVMSSIRKLYLFNGYESFISKVFIRSGKFIKRLLRNVKRKS